MNIEIERKFLVIGDSWRAAALSRQMIRQGYLTDQGAVSVRIRITDSRALLTLKGERDGIARSEFEYEIPVCDAEEMLRTFGVGRLIEKTRFSVEYRGLTWEIDVFSGWANGLIIAEVELEDVDQIVELPSWVGAEVSHDRRYRNATLALADAPPISID